eukprot:CAMPEP_0175158060 /NCGR_PEP_ID=MMETSP0087-20121206/22590_1 /TAXON_ID=136419 /ORGANISM="Unknown Unknown, Strain D1" /LENGTH=58 /DNA_ID=CAMNT_0016445823 /DNA_START=266 /DNA_END=442 /DNA_ORIENTATION=+
MSKKTISTLSSVVAGVAFASAAPSMSLHKADPQDSKQVQMGGLPDLGACRETQVQQTW